jgi:cobalt-zinc-cadmium efflux system outer membrane protein
VFSTTQVRGTVLSLLLSAFTCLSVQAGQVPRSINEIIALALKQSAELSALEKEATVQNLLAIQAGTHNNPTLELQGATGSLTGSPEDRLLSIGINQEFTLNNKLNLRREVFQREAESVQRLRENTARLLKDDLATLVLDYVQTSQRIELAAEVVKLNRDLVAIAAERFTAGDISELDRNITKVELARAENRLLEIERERIPLRIKLASMTGLSESDVTLYEKISTPELVHNTQELVKKALEYRPDLLTLTNERQKAELGLRLAGAEALPNLTAGIFVQWQRASTELGALSSINTDTQLGLRLSIPIPLFNRNNAGIAAARTRLDAADLRKLALERAIVAEVETAVSRMSASQRILALFEQGIIPQLAENLKLTQEAYRVGEVGILSVLDEQKKFFEVNDSYLSAQHSRRVALIKLETAVATELGGGVQ